MNAASTNLRKLVKVINLRGFDKYVIFNTNLRTKTTACLVDGNSNNDNGNRRESHASTLMENERGFDKSLKLNTNLKAKKQLLVGWK